MPGSNPSATDIDIAFRPLRPVERLLLHGRLVPLPEDGHLGRAGA